MSHPNPKAHMRFHALQGHGPHCWEPKALTGPDLALLEVCYVTLDKSLLFLSAEIMQTFQSKENSCHEGILPG